MNPCDLYLRPCDTSRFCACVLLFIPFICLLLLDLPPRFWFMAKIAKSAPKSAGPLRANAYRSTHPRYVPARCLLDQRRYLEYPLPQAPRRHKNNPHPAVSSVSLQTETVEQKATLGWSPSDY